MVHSQRKFFVAALAVLVVGTAFAGTASAQTYSLSLFQNPNDNRYTLLFPTFFRRTLVRIKFVGLSNPSDAKELQARIWAHKRGNDKPRTGYFRDGQEVWVDRDSGKDQGNYVGNLRFGGRNPAGFLKQNPGVAVEIEVLDD